MRRRRESFAELLLKLPWWVSVGLGILAFGIIRWGSPLWAADDPGRQMLTKGIIPLAPLVLLVFGIFGVGSFFFARKRHHLVDEQTSLDQLRQTSWKDFEYLVAEAYRRQGYQVQYSLGRGADGGVDLTHFPFTNLSSAKMEQDTRPPTTVLPA
jgi:restriction system protein